MVYTTLSILPIYHYENHFISAVIALVDINNIHYIGSSPSLPMVLDT